MKQKHFKKLAKKRTENHYHYERKAKQLAQRSGNGNYLVDNS